MTVRLNDAELLAVQLGRISNKCCDRPDGITGYGTPDNIMFIGIAPGRDEATRTKRPLTGPSGKLLDAVLEAVGIKRASCYATNLICYWKDAPTKEEIAVCNPRLLKEIAAINPKIIVLLGKLACETVLQIPFSKARGAVVLRDNIYYLTTYHPAASLHKGTTAVEKELQINAAYDLCRDLSKLPRILGGAYKWIEPTYTIISTAIEAQNFLNQLITEIPVALDIENNFDKEHEKAHPFDHKITCIGIGWSPRHCYILTGDAISSNLRWPQDVQYTYHNGVFDTVEIMRELGVMLPIVRDTMLESYAVDERSIRGLHKLKSLQREWLGAPFYEETEHEDQQALLEYNAYDVTGTVRLDAFLTKRMQEEETEQYYTNILIPVANMLAKSQYRGIYVNQQHVREIANIFGTEFFALEEELAQFNNETLGAPDFNIRSPKQIMAMMKYQGYNLLNTRKATLQELLDHEDIPFVRKLLRYRTLYRLIKVYLLDVQKQIKYDGRVHPHAFLIGTNTGRLTYKDPAMQTLPKPKTVKDLGVIRKIFSSSSDDYILLEADYAQIEAWIGQYVSQDPVLLADLTSGSWHDRTTEDVFKISKATVSAQEWAEYRDAGKHLNYGCFFEEGPEGLTRRPPIGMGCTLQVAKEYLNRWYKRYAKYDEWRHLIKKQATEQGYITTPFGRKRRFPLVVSDHQLRQMVNAPIQSIANDYTLTSNIKLAPLLSSLYDTHLLFIEHDGTYWEVNRQYLKEVVALIRQVMESAPLPGLPQIPVVIEVGPNLAELEKYDENRIY